MTPYVDEEKVLALSIEKCVMKLSLPYVIYKYAAIFYASFLVSFQSGLRQILL